jgi:xylulokinase
MLILGLDSGTQSAKACIWDLQGTCVARAMRPLSVQNPRDGWAEQDPGEWWEAARGAVAEVVSQVDPGQIAGLGVAFQRETFALLDDTEAAVRPGILWLDIRASEEVSAAARHVAPDAYHRRTGKPLDVTSVLPRMLWLARHEPGILSRCRRWTDVGAYLVGKLTGTPATCTAGADTTGLVDVQSRWWAPDLLTAAGLDRLEMPGLFEPGAVAGALTAEAARATGLREGIPVVLAGGDGQSFAVGLGARSGSGFTLTLGTSIVLGLPSLAPSISSLYRTLIAARPDGQYLLEAVIQAGTYIVRWFTDTFGGAEQEAETERAVSDVPPGSAGLVTVPHWWGVRFPESMPQARGATIGWSHVHTRWHFLRSLLEGVAFELKKLAADFGHERPGIDAPLVTAAGGGARSGTWLRILCDTMDLPLARSVEAEPAALGAAILASVALGGYADVDTASRAMTRRGEILQPDPDTRTRYEALFRSSYLPLREAALRISGLTPR